jgi:DNA polymerase-3 subunit epsilon
VARASERFVIHPMLPAPAFAFVDLETTGTRAGIDRITEVGIVRVDDAAAGPPRITEWSSLVDPEVPIPPVIQALTGITDAMVASAPTFSTIAPDVLRMLAGCIFVAHNARFDYGFLKHAFARLERPFSARVLCTVRLSRRLFPDSQGHGLDALIARHALHAADRHRALGDARAIWSFMQVLYRDLERERVDATIKRLLRIPSLPPQLPPDTLDALPEAPGIYLFYGENPLPLYIGKSVNLRERVGAHFSQDWRSETDLRLSQEIRRIEHEETAGELGALIRESVLIKARLPAHNRALRRKAEAGILELCDGVPKFVPAAGIDCARLSGGYGPFASRASMRAALRERATAHRLCWIRLRLECRDSGPCFARQLRRCKGVCVGAEAPEDHDARLCEALASLAIPDWPLEGPAMIRERSSRGERTDVHVICDWCWLGTARDDGELAQLIEAPQRPEFDLDVTRLLLRRYAAGTLALLPVGRAPSPCVEQALPDPFERRESMSN